MHQPINEICKSPFLRGAQGYGELRKNTEKTLVVKKKLLKTNFWIEK